MSDSPEPDAEQATSRSGTEDGRSRDEAVRHEVVVPDEIYRVVTVFSTLLAVGFVVGGMIALDVATARGTAAREEVDLLLATVGVLAVVGGAAVYAFASRFRAAGMGNPKDEDGPNSE